MGNKNTKINPNFIINPDLFNQKNNINKFTYLTKNISLHHIDNFDYIKYFDGFNQYVEKIIAVYIKNNNYDQMELIEFLFDNQSKLLLFYRDKFVFCNFITKDNFIIEEQIYEYKEIGNSQFDLISKLFI